MFTEYAINIDSFTQFSGVIEAKDVARTRDSCRQTIQHIGVNYWSIIDICYFVPIYTKNYMFFTV